MRLDKDKIKESLTKEEVDKIIESLGGSYHSDDNKGNPKYSTICHGGDSFDKLYYYSENHNFQCYTNCGHISDIYDLVIKAKEAQGVEYSFPDALKYVTEITGKRIVSDKRRDENSNLVNDWDLIDRITKKRPKPNTKLPAYNENVLDVFMSYKNNWIDEGITPEIAKMYEVGWYFKEDQITIPHRDKDGRLIGIRSRNTDERAEMGMKYIPTIVGGTQYSHLIHQNLFGLYQNKDAIVRNRKVMLLEGEKSVMICEKYYSEDNFTVAVSGSNVSNFQRDLILNLGVDEVFIAFDKHSEKATDKQIMIYKQKLVRLARLFTPFCRTYILYDDFDLIGFSDAPVDHGKEIFEELMRKKYEIATYETEME